MKIHVELQAGYLPDAYSKYASENAKQAGQPIVSFPITLEQLPENTTSLALSLIDYDATPRTGFPFIHWLAADMPVSPVIAVDFSRRFDGPQGHNSWASRFYDFNDPYVMTHYAGPVPPDKPHRYTLRVFAVDVLTGLPNAFYYNTFLDALAEHVIDSAFVVLPARN